MPGARPSCADYVLEIHLDKLRLYQPGSLNQLYEGRGEVSVFMYDVEDGVTEPRSYVHNYLYPKTGVRPADALPVGAFRKEFLERLAVELCSTTSITRRAAASPRGGRRRQGTGDWRQETDRAAQRAALLRCAWGLSLIQSVMSFHLTHDSCLRFPTCEPGSAMSALAISTIAKGHVRHAAVLRAVVPPQGLHAALRVSRAAGADPPAVSRLPPLRSDHLHRLRQVRPRLPGRLHLHRQGEGPAAGEGFVVTGFKIDYTKCMFCALCVDPCPVDCIFMGSNFDLCTFSRDGCVVDYAKLPLEVAWGQATLNPTAVQESKRVSLPVWTKRPRPAKPVRKRPLR